MFEADADAFAETAKAKNFLAEGGGEGRSGSAKKERAGDADVFERLVEDALLEGFEIDRDVGKFGHGVERSGKRLQEYAKLSYNKRAGEMAKAIQANRVGGNQATRNCGRAGKKDSELAARTGEKNSYRSQHRE